MEILAGKPYVWKSTVYGDIAVHVTGFSPNGAVAILSIDGGEASTPAQRFPEWADGIAYASLHYNELHKRPATRARKAPAGTRTLPTEKAATPVKPARKPRAQRTEASNNGEVTF